MNQSIFKVSRFTEDEMARYEACKGWLGIAPIPRSPGT
jgi:hypothetical protein